MRLCSLRQRLGERSNGSWRAQLWTTPARSLIALLSKYFSTGSLNVPLDRKEFEKLADFFTEGAVGEFKARASSDCSPMVITGRQDLIEFARRSIRKPRDRHSAPAG